MRSVTGTAATTALPILAILLAGNPVAAQSAGPSTNTGAEGGNAGETSSPSSGGPPTDVRGEATRSSPHAGQPGAVDRPGQVSAPPPVAPRPYAAGLTMPTSCGSPLCARWAPPQVPYGRGLRPVRPATTYRPIGPPVGIERPPQPEEPPRARGFDFGRLTLEGLGGWGGFLVGSLIGYPLIIGGAFGGSEPLIYSGLVLVELGWATGLHLVGQLLDVDGSFALALAGTLLGGLVGGLLGALASKAEGSAGAAPLGILAFGAFLYVPAVVYEWGAGAYDD